MTTNLVLKSTDSIIYTGGRAQFRVSWAQYLDDPDAHYLVSFSFITAVDANLDETDLYVLGLDNVGNLKNIQGGNTSSSNTKDIGLIYSEEPHSSHARLRAEFSTNPPVTLIGRPSQDIFDLTFKDLTGALSAKTPQFVCFLRFEKI
jgi:hypothetical protein